MSGTLAEKILLYRLQTKRDPEAYAELYDTYVKRIYRFVYFKVRTHEEAEDITSEVFLRAWHYLQEEKPLGSFSGLLYKIARNAIIDTYRAKSRRGAEVLLDETVEVGDGGKWYADVVSSVTAQEVLRGLTKLKQEYQEVITLRYVDELEIDEIAEIIGKGKIAVRVTLHRAVKKLQDILEEKNGPNENK